MPFPGPVRTRPGFGRSVGDLQNQTRDVHESISKLSGVRGREIEREKRLWGVFLYKSIIESSLERNLIFLSIFVRNNISPFKNNHNNLFYI